MRPRSVCVVLLLLAAAGWAVVAHPPGVRVVRQINDVRAVPTPTPLPAHAPVTLLFAGDIMLSRSVGDEMALRRGWTWPFESIASVTKSADLAFANLETTISTRGVANGCGFCFRADPRVVAGLAFAGFDVLSVANNHIWDYGLSALEDTLGYLASSSINAVGAGRTIQEARGPVVRAVGETTFAFLAYTDILPSSAKATTTRAGVNLYDPVGMADDIARARLLADVVIVSFHTGTEYDPVHNANQQNIYHAAIDAGADLVVGHHPHVVQDFEHYKGKLIAYSLGNFVFDQNWSEDTRKGALLEVTVQNGDIISVASLSVDISKQYQPSLRR